MNAHEEVLAAAREATTMGFWDGAVHRLLANGWTVELMPVNQDEFPRLAKFHAQITHGTQRIQADDSDGTVYPWFGEAYAEDFAEALSSAITNALSETGRFLDA